MSLTPQHREQLALTREDEPLKNVLKAAVIEVLQERPDQIRSALEETLEDIALVRAIHEGEQSGNASREEIFTLLRGEA